MDKDRATHLQWCKNRALEYVRAGDMENAIASMQSDLTKHPETHTPEIIKRTLDTRILYGSSMATRVILWIEGFN